MEQSANAMRSDILSVVQDFSRRIILDNRFAKLPSSIIGSQPRDNEVAFRTGAPRRSLDEPAQLGWIVQRTWSKRARVGIPAHQFRIGIPREMLDHVSADFAIAGHVIAMEPQAGVKEPPGRLVGRSRFEQTREIIGGFVQQADAKI